MVRQKFMATAAALTLFIVSPPMTAVGQQQPLTDNELRASYCLGYFKGQLDLQEQMLSYACHDGDEAAITACRSRVTGGHTIPAEDRYRRTLSYLTAKGIWFGNNNSGFMAVEGKQDLQRCVAEAQTPESLECFKESAASCGSPLPEKNMSEAKQLNRAEAWSRCISQRCDSQTCRKAKTCESMDFLPY
jgi:hypothetical protein